jgi:hypothetical protein
MEMTVSTCSVEGCEKKVSACGWCSTHYQRMRFTGRLDLVRPEGYGSRSKHPARAVWAQMKQRCYNPKRHNYADYGGRGIKVHEEWRNDFWAFVRDVGERPSMKHQLDRIDVNGNYEPGNVRWVLPAKNSRNKRNNVMTSVTASAIRTLRQNGMTYREIAESTSTNITTVFDIANGHTWADKPRIGSRERPHKVTWQGPTPVEWDKNNREHPLYQSWKGIKQRCTNPKHASYPNYGGRGIRLHAEWADDFRAFLRGVGPRPDWNYSLDRIDEAKGYEPGNVRWATRSDQMKNVWQGKNRRRG